MTDRLSDLMRQGFMKGVKARKKPAPIVRVRCHGCLNWHAQNKHSASKDERKANMRDHKGPEQEVL